MFRQCLKTITTGCLLYAAIGLGLAVISCGKPVEPSVTSELEPTPEENGLVELVYSVNEQDAIDTKVTVTELGNIGTVYHTITNGTPGSSESVEHSGSCTFVSNPVSTGYYVASGPTRRFYVSNVAPTYTAGTHRVTIAASNDTDIVVGFSNTASTSVSLNLGHIYSRIGVLTMTKQAGYDSISDVSWQIRRSNSSGGTTGTYVPAYSSWESCTGLASDTALASGNGVNADLYVIPGSYVVSCTYTLHKGAFTETITATATVDMTVGQVNNISGTAVGGHAAEVTFSVTTAPWGTSHNVSEES